MAKVPIFDWSGQLAGPSEPKLAWASEQAVWPSAASGLMVRPGGRVTVADFSSEGEAAKHKNAGALSLMLSPDGASVSDVVGLAYRTGLKTSRSHLVVSGYSD